MDPTMIALLVVVGILLLVALWALGLYNGLVRLRNTTDESWADVDTELKRRYDLIPNLVSTVKAYAAHERQVLERVTAARTAAANNNGSPRQQAGAENELVAGLRQLFAVVEGYPNLKANQNFLQLQTELANTENRIQQARRFYNANVRDLNTRIETVPTNLVAGACGFKTREYFEIEDAAVRQAPQVTT